ncbi:hypothetical protein BX666DRAFT_1923212 [Dichotomocladium elegans]|nr:hypothetical protein BX666DRAFT_1923212 [Dichotomocladium elegans]
MSTVDTWLSSECKALEDCLSNALDGHIGRKRLNTLESLYYMLNLLQAHRPFMSHEGGVKAQSVRSSFEICFLTVIIISHLVHTIPFPELVNLSVSPPTLDVMVMGLHIHLQNACAPESDRRTVIFSEICFERMMNRLEQLPIIAENVDSMVSYTLAYLREKYHKRPNPIISGYPVSSHQHPHSTYAQQESLQQPHHHHHHHHQQRQNQSADICMPVSYKSTEPSQYPSSPRALTFITVQSKSLGHRSQQSKRKLSPPLQAFSESTPLITPTMLVEPVPIETIPTATPTAIEFATETDPTIAVDMPGTCLTMYNQPEYFFSVPEGDPDLPSAILLNDDLHFLQ